MSIGTHTRRARLSDDRRTSSPAPLHTNPPVVLPHTGGVPLDPATLGFFEARLGFDFGNVRIHADDHATRSARLLGAEAYTVGNHIALDPAHYRPGTAGGRGLLAHELVHVVQQTASREGRESSSSACEGEASRASSVLVRGTDRVDVGERSPPRVAARLVMPFEPLSPQQLDQLSPDELRAESARAYAYYGQARDAATSNYMDVVNRRISVPLDPAARERSRKTALLDQRARIDPGGTADDLLRTSPTIGGFVRKNMDVLGRRAGGGQTIVHQKAEDFAEAAVQDERTRPRKKPLTVAEEGALRKEANDLGGFVDVSRRAHLPPEFTYESALHEATHIQESDAFKGLGFNVSEGATDYFTSFVRDEHGAAPSMPSRGANLRVTGYGPQRNAIEALFSFLGPSGFNLLANAYFQGKTADLEAEVLKRIPGGWQRWLDAMKASDYATAYRVLFPPGGSLATSSGPNPSTTPRSVP